MFESTEIANSPEKTYSKMAEEKFDARRDKLVMETKTLWDPALGNISSADKDWLSHAVHAEPEKATKIAYERSHTGFVREITVTVADVARLYQEKAPK